MRLAQRAEECKLLYVDYSKFKERRIAAMKKIIIMIISVVLAVCCAVSVSASSGIDVDEAYIFADAFLTEYYYAIKMGEPYDFTQYISNESLLAFVQSRVDFGSDYRPSIYDFSMITILREHEDLGNCMYLFVAVQMEYHYYTSIGSSGSGEGVELLIVEGENGLEIVDWYIPHDPHHDVTRGYAEINDPMFWDNAVNSSAVLSAQSDWLTDFRIANDARAEAKRLEQEALAEEQEQAEIDGQAQTQSVQVTPTATTATLKSLNKQAIVSWAMKYYKSSSPYTGNPYLVASL